jgi:hypothetical protein
MRRHLVTEAQKFLKTGFQGPEEVDAVSFIWKKVPEGELYTHPKSPRVENAVKRVLRASGIELALGGLRLTSKKIAMKILPTGPFI